MSGKIIVFFVSVFIKLPRKSFVVEVATRKLRQIRLLDHLYSEGETVSRTTIRPDSWPGRGSDPEDRRPVRLPKLTGRKRYEPCDTTAAMKRPFYTEERPWWPRPRAEKSSFSHKINIRSNKSALKWCRWRSLPSTRRPATILTTFEPREWFTRKPETPSTDNTNKANKRLPCERKILFFNVSLFIHYSWIEIFSIFLF